MKRMGTVDTLRLAGQVHDVSGWLGEVDACLGSMSCVSEAQYPASCTGNLSGTPCGDRTESQSVVCRISGFDVTEFVGALCCK
jgi:hypothetical protein